MRCSLLLLSFVCVSSLFVLVLGQTDTALLTASVDRISARSARIRFLSAATGGIASTLIQYTNVSSEFVSMTRTQFHNYITGSGPILYDDHEIVIPQVGNIPIDSYVLRNLKPATAYEVRVAYIDTQAIPQIQGTSTPTDFTTAALSNNTLLSSLLASGGCGQLTSSGSLYYLTLVTDTSGTKIYQCSVVAETSNVTITIVPQYAYATINTATTPTLTATNTTLSVTSAYADPLVQYNTTLTLGAQGSQTNFSWTVTAEDGTTQNYILSVIRAIPTSTAQVTGPSTPVTALIKSPAVATSFSYRGLLWASTSVGFWKVWSDDLVTFPFTSFNITFPNTLSGGGADTTLAVVQVTPATASVPDGSCSNVNVALFDQLGRSSTVTTCISALDDYCSPTPFGAATNWQSPFTNGAITPTLQMYYPAPPTPFFPAA